MIGVESLEVAGQENRVRHGGEKTAGPWSFSSPSYEPKTKMRSRCSGPPDVPPN